MRGLDSQEGQCAGSGGSHRLRPSATPIRCPSPAHKVLAPPCPACPALGVHTCSLPPSPPCTMTCAVGSRGRISHYLLPAPWEEDEIRRDRVEPQSVSLSWREPIPAGGPGANNTEYEIRYYEKVSGTFPMPTSQQEPFSGFPGIPPPHPSLLSCLALQSLLPLLDSAPGPPLFVFSPLLLTHS